MPDTLREFLRTVAERGGALPGVTISGTTLSYAAVLELARRGAGMLATLDVVEGDIVMARCANGVPFLAAWLGCIELGAVFMPVNSLLTGPPLRAVLAHAQGRVLIVDDELRREFDAVRGQLPELRHVVVAGGAPRAGEHSFERLLDTAPTAGLVAPTLNPAAPARLMYTSGTTGTPKGALWSRTAETVHARCYGDELVRTAPGEAVFSCLPLFHATCQGTLLGTLWRGGHITIDATFDPFRFWARVRETNAVFFPYVGTILAVLAKRPRRADDRTVPVRRVMGSAAPADRWREIEERFDLVINDVWGQTELASCWTLPTSETRGPGTVGRPVPRFEARLVDPTSGHEAGRGVTGEMWIRPLLPHLVFEGYFRDEQGTAQMWTHDGWYRTGDLLHRNDDGDYVFSGRLRDAIRRRGEMITPAPIEAAALERTEVGEAAAIGVPASDGVEEEVKLCVVPAEGQTVDATALWSHLQTVLPRFMMPRYIEVYASFPKTATTRIQKYRLQADGVTGAWDSRARSLKTVEPAP